MAGLLFTIIKDAGPDKKGVERSGVELFSGDLLVDQQEDGVVLAEKNKFEIGHKIARLNVPFISNQGQANENVKFYVKTFGGNVFVTKDGEIVYSLPKLSSDNKHEAGVVLKEQLIGATVTDISGQDQVETKISYFQGSDESKWQSSIPSYEYVSLGEVYKGIDVRLKAYGNNIEKYFFINPGANPQEIKVKIDGAKSLDVDEAGQLCVETDLGEVTFTKPVAYQDVNGSRKYVEVAYAVKDDQYSFSVGDYDRTNTLVIDPLLASTFLGANYLRDSISDIAIDQWGNVYVVGTTYTTKFPTTPGAYDETFNGSFPSSNRNIFISKLDSNLTTFIASTFIGTGYMYTPALVLDGIGNVYITSATNSGFPTTSGAYSRSRKGSHDAIVSKLDRNLTTLIASTYIGGSERDFSHDIALDRDGSIYVVGQTGSADFPTTYDAYDIDYSGVTRDLFISKFDNNLSTLISSTYFGGSKDEAVGINSKLVLSNSGYVYVAGTTASSDFPTTSGAYNVNYNGSVDVFISKFDNDLTALIASTFFGGNEMEGRGASFDMVMDKTGKIYISGSTESSNLPTTLGAYDNTFNGGDRDGFVSVFNENLTDLLTSTFIGGSYPESCRAIGLDGDGNVYVAGSTGSVASISSNDFPTTPGAYDNGFNRYFDGFISILDSDLVNLKFSSFLGGNSIDNLGAMIIDKDKNVWVAGYTSSSNFPITPDAYDDSLIYRTLPNAVDAFISKLDPELSAGNAQPVDINTDYEYVLYEGATELNSIELINRNDISQAVTVEVFSSAEGLLVSLPDGSSIDLLERETSTVPISVDATSASAGTYDLQLKVTDSDANVSFAVTAHT